MEAIEETIAQFERRYGRAVDYNRLTEAQRELLVHETVANPPFTGSQFTRLELALTPEGIVYLTDILDYWIQGVIQPAEYAAKRLSAYSIASGGAECKELKPSTYEFTLQDSSKVQVEFKCYREPLL